MQKSWEMHALYLVLYKKHIFYINLQTTANLITKVKRDNRSAKPSDSFFNVSILVDIVTSKSRKFRSNLGT